MYDRLEVKSLINQMVCSGNYKSYLAISHHLNIAAELVRELFRELQAEWEMEENQYLCEP